MNAPLPAAIHALDLTDAELAQRVLRLQRRGYAAEAALIDYAGIPALTEDLAALQGCPASFYGDLRGAELAGAIALERSSEGELEIQRLVVDPDWFRRGVGRGLLRFALEQAGGAGASVSTAEANAPARRLFESEGFRLSAERVLEDGLRLVRFTRSGERAPHAVR